MASCQGNAHPFLPEIPLSQPWTHEVSLDLTPRPSKAPNMCVAARTWKYDDTVRCVTQGTEVP